MHRGVTDSPFRLSQRNSALSRSLAVNRLSAPNYARSTDTGRHPSHNTEKVSDRENPAACSWILSFITGSGVASRSTNPNSKSVLNPVRRTLLGIGTNKTVRLALQILFEQCRVGAYSQGSLAPNHIRGRGWPALMKDRFLGKPALNSGTNTGPLLTQVDTICSSSFIHYSGQPRHHLSTSLRNSYASRLDRPGETPNVHFERVTADCRQHVELSRRRLRSIFVSSTATFSRLCQSVSDVIPQS